MNFKEYEQLVDDTFITGNFDEEHMLAGLVAEVGEVAGKYQKAYRSGQRPYPHDVILELGDVLWYLTALANYHGYSLHNIACLNRDKLLSRKDRGKIEGDGDHR